MAVELASELPGGWSVPWLPPERYVDLGGGRVAFVRDAGPRDAPVLMLLHGLGATADLNWFTAYASLAQTHRVIAMDMRGCGRGTSPPVPFTLEDCAADVAVLAQQL